MDASAFRIRYDGGDADKHVIDMRLLGESLVGLERILSDGLIILAHQRASKKGERAPVLLKAKEPVAGSVEIFGDLQEAYVMLQFGIPIVQQVGATFLWQWFKGVVNYNSGRKDIAEVCMEAMVQINQDHLAARDRSDARAHEERMALYSLVREGMPRLAPSAAMFAAPIGSSVESAGFSSGTSVPVVVDREMAAALKDNGEVVWSDPLEMILKTDGFTFHTGKLSVEHPARPGFIQAEVRDPVFSQDGNPYALAASQKQAIRVLASMGHKGEKLDRIAVLKLIGIAV